jgi:hypothetical protein
MGHMGPDGPASVEVANAARRVLFELGDGPFQPRELGRRLLLEHPALVAGRPLELGDPGVDGLGQALLGLSEPALEVKPSAVEGTVELTEAGLERSVERGDGVRLPLHEVSEPGRAHTAGLGTTRWRVTRSDVTNCIIGRQGAHVAQYHTRLPTVELTSRNAWIPATMRGLVATLGASSVRSAFVVR